MKQSLHEKQLLAKEEGEQNVTTDTLLHKYSLYWKLLRVTAFVRHFIENCRKAELHKVPLSTLEFQAEDKFWITQTQPSQPLKSDVELKKNDEGKLRGVSSVRCYHAVFLPKGSISWLP